MTLSFTALDKHIQFRDFSCQLANFEVALDVLSKITELGSKILTAYIIDEGNRIELSVEAFDGEPFADPIRQLEKQWQAILSEPVRSEMPTDNWRIDLTRQQIEQFDKQIAQLSLIIDKLEQFRQQTEATRNEQRKARLIQQYDTSLSTYRYYVNRARENQYIAQKKLAHLQGKAVS